GRKNTSSSIGCVDREKPFNLIYASTLHPLRNAYDLISGFLSFEKSNPGEAILHIYGDGPDKARLEKQVADAGSQCVRFYGLIPQEDLIDIMGTMDGAIGWVPKSIYNESPSLKVLEYLAAGLPVLAT